MFGEQTAADLSPWDDFDFKVTYYGFLLSVTALLFFGTPSFSLLLSLKDRRGRGSSLAFGKH
jgi:hypothetical protein